MILRKIGMITIGQSPRIDIIPETREVLGTDVEMTCPPKTGPGDELE